MTGMELKLQRIRSGKKQYEVAAAVGICPTLLCAFEKERRTLRPECLRRIVDYLTANCEAQTVQSSVSNK